MPAAGTSATSSTPIQSEQKCDMLSILDFKCLAMVPLRSCPRVFLLQCNQQASQEE